MIDLLSPAILASGGAAAGAVAPFGRWMHEGGVFLWLILLCGFASLFVTVLRALWLRRGQMMPPKLVEELERLENDPSALERLRRMSGGGGKESPLAKIILVAFNGAAGDLPDLEGAVEARARREVVAMQWGLPMLESIITIAPMLGLLGTVAGLVDVFGGISGAEKDFGRIAMGVGMALYTTIAGLAVAVPSVIVHTVFSSTVERCAVEMEVLMHRLVGRLVKPSKG